MCKKICIKIRNLLLSPVAWISNILFYRQFIGSHRLFFDIGANIGFKTNIFKTLGVSVVSVEPQSTCFDTLYKRFSKDAKVMLLKKGVASKPGRLDIHISSVSSPISTFSNKWQKDGRFNEYSFDKTEAVDMVTLDDLIVAHGMPDFIKVDVEGFECEVFEGLTQKVPCVSFEFTSEFFSDATVIIDRLASLGFTQFNYCEGEEMKLRLSSWKEKDAFLSMLHEKVLLKEDFWGDVYAT